MENKYLILARQARSENNAEDAKRFYDMARTEDPTNAEAKFFYALYNVEDAVNKDVPNKFMDLTKVASTSIGLLSDTAESTDEKVEICRNIIEAFIKECKSIPDYIHSKLDRGENSTGIYSLSQYQTCLSYAGKGLSDAGDKVIQILPNEEKAFEVAAQAWKAAVDTSTKIPLTKKGREEFLNKYVPLIKKIDRNYEPPKPKGCFGGAVQIGI